MKFIRFIKPGALLLVTMAFFVPGCAGEEKTMNFATIDDEGVTEAQVKAEAATALESLELQRMQAKAEFLRKEQEILEKATTRLVEEKLLGLEAARREITREQLVEREILQKVAEPTGEEIDEFYEENQSRINRPREAVVEQIRRYLRERDEQRVRAAFLKRLEEEHKVARLLEPLRFEVKADGYPALGPKSAPVTLALFSDFQCPYCRDYADTLKDIVKNYGDKVRLVFRQFPLTSIHPNAQRAAEASLCAADQNRFWEMHDLLFENQKELTEENILTQAKKLESLEFDAGKFKNCLTGSIHRADVKADLRAGAEAGTDSTPSLFINGLYLSGGQPYDVVAAVIDSELAKKK